MKDILTKENITFALALIGSAGTISMWIFNWYRHRFKIRVSILAYTHSAASGNRAYWCNFLFDNLSRSPVAIRRINLLIGENPIPCRIDSQAIIRVESKTIPGEYIMRKTLQFPVNLSGLESISGYVLFVSSETSPLVSSTHLNLQVCTNRGTVKKLTLSLEGVQNLQKELFV